MGAKIDALHLGGAHSNNVHLVQCRVPRTRGHATLKRQIIESSLLPSPTWAEGIVLCLFVCVCYHKIAVQAQLSQNLNKLHLTNLVILDKQWFSTKQASSCRQTWLKWQVKLKTKN